MKKKILSLILCSALAFLSVTTANANEIDTSSFVDLKNEFNLPQGSLLLSGYNIDKDHPGTMRYSEKGFRVELKFNNCSEIPRMVKFNSDISHCIAWIAANGKLVTGGSINTSDCTGGKYRKVRVKLSDFSDSFTEDGKIKYEDTDDKVYIGDLTKKTKSDGTTYYDSFCVIKSGAAHTAVIPDKNGEAEFYISTNPYHETTLVYELVTRNFRGLIIGEGTDIRFGDVNKSGYTDVNDVTQIQLALSGAVTLDTYSKFNADINLDGIRDIKDATALQLALASKSK